MFIYLQLLIRENILEEVLNIDYCNQLLHLQVFETFPEILKIVQPKFFESINKKFFKLMQVYIYCISIAIPGINKCL